jgi:hypothetical protein
MPELGAIQSNATAAPEPSENELAPPKLLVNADAASPQASLNAVTNTAEQKNMMNNIKVGGGTKRRRLPRRRTCTCRRKKCRCMSRGRGIRSRSRSRSRRRKSKSYRFTASQRQIVNRRVELNLLHRKIRKNKNNQNRTRTQRLAQYGGNLVGTPVATTPQHGESCGPDQHNCPGNSSALLLEASRQSTVNAQGDNPVV